MTSFTGNVVRHPWGPVYDARSKVLILGTMPSPKSREAGFYYGHPQNIFWPTLARVLGLPAPGGDRTARERFLLDNHVALWDVLDACRIEGAADGSIREPVVNRFRPVIERSAICAVFTTGRTATELFNRHCAAEADMYATYLPSTSPANRAAQAKPTFLRRWMALADILLRLY